MKKKKSRSLRLFNYKFIVYEQFGIIKDWERGFFREKNAEDAKNRAREIWKSKSGKMKMILVANENKKLVVHHSTHK